MSRVGDRSHVLEIAGRVEEVGRHDQGGLVVNALGERRRRDRHPVRAGHKLDLEVRPAEPLVADGGEVQLADENLVPALRQGQPGGQGRQGHRDGGGDGRGPGRRLQHPEPCQQRKPVRIPGRGTFFVPILGVPGQGGPAALGQRAEGAGVEVDVAVQEGKLGPQGIPVRHR